MAPTARPAGTDGSDHAYRETVDDAYKGAPIWRAAGWLALHFTAVPLVLKLAWAAVPYYLFGEVEVAPWLILGLYLLARLSWTIAQPATYKEKLPWVKATNSLIIITAGLHGAVLYKYHAVNVKQTLWSRRILKHLVEEEGWNREAWQVPFSFIEPFIDGSLFVMLFITGYCLHQFIMRKMGMLKKLKEDKEQIKKEAAIAASPAAGARPRSRRA